MDNELGGAIDVAEIAALDPTSERDDYCVIQLCRVEDVPSYDDGYVFSGTRQDIYIKAYISKDLTIPGLMCISDFGSGMRANDDYMDYLKITHATRQIGRLSDIHYTLRKYDQGAAIWNSYHNFKIKPPPGALLTVELYHASRKQSVNAAERAFHHGETPDAAHGLLGSVHIPLEALTEKTTKYAFDQENKKFKNFGVYLRRVYIEKNPPRIKTFFLVRHGESKWNLAQEKGSISGMLHRDHSLTATGANQARAFNKSWRKYIEDDRSVEDVHQAEVASYVEEVITTEDRKHRRHHHQLTEEEKAMIHGTIPAKTGNSERSPSPSLGVWGKMFGSGSKKHRSDTMDSVDTSENRSRSSSIDMEFDAHRSNTSEKSKGNDSDIGSTTVDSPSDSQKASRSTTQLVTETEKKLMMPAQMVARRCEYIKLFLEADEIYASPLTRAIQTALFALEVHPALHVNGLHLNGSLREFKGMGGLDTVGREFGPGVKRRVIEELQDIVGEHEAERLSTVELNLLDAELHWWTDLNHFEGSKEMNERMCEFLDFAHFCEAKCPIFVGHSNFFRFFYSNYLSDIIQHNRPTLCSDLKRHRLSNACTLAVTVLFEDEEDEVALKDSIVDLKAGVKHGNSNSRHKQQKASHSARIIDADVIFSDRRLSFANGNKAVEES